MASIPIGGQAMLSTNGNPSWPDVVAFLYGSGTSTAAAFQNLAGLKDSILTKYLEGVKSQDASWVGISLGLPKSVGQIKLRSSNPMDPPLIDPNFYSDSKGDDIKAMVTGKIYDRVVIRRIIHTPLHF